MPAIIIPALKILLSSLAYVIIPAISFFIYYKFVDWFIAIALGAIGEFSTLTLSVGGLGGWMLGQLRAAECLSIYLSCLTLGFCIKLAKR